MLRRACEFEELCWSAQVMERRDNRQNKLRLPFVHILLNASFTNALVVRQNAAHGTEIEPLYTIKKQDIWP